MIQHFLIIVKQNILTTFHYACQYIYLSIALFLFINITDIVTSILNESEGTIHLQVCQTLQSLTFHLF